MEPTVYIETSIISYLAARPSRDLVTAEADALHIAIAATSGMDYLLTWNCRHIANAQIRARIEAFTRQRGIEPPILAHLRS